MDDGEFTSELKSKADPSVASCAYIINSGEEIWFWTYLSCQRRTDGMRETDTDIKQKLGFCGVGV